MHGGRDAERPDPDVGTSCKEQGQTKKQHTNKRWERVSHQTPLCWRLAPQRLTQLPASVETHNAAPPCLFQLGVRQGKKPADRWGIAPRPPALGVPLTIMHQDNLEVDCLGRHPTAPVVFDFVAIDAFVLLSLSLCVTAVIP